MKERGAGLQAVRRRSGRGVSSARQPPLWASSGRLLSGRGQGEWNRGQARLFNEAGFFDFFGGDNGNAKGRPSRFFGLKGQSGETAQAIYIAIYIKAEGTDNFETQKSRYTGCAGQGSGYKIAP